MYNEISPITFSYAQGTEVTRSGTHFCTWSEHREVELIIYRADGTVARKLPMARTGGGFFSVSDPEGRAGDLYKYRFGGSTTFPDPASRYQPLGVHGPSMVIANVFNWT